MGRQALEKRHMGEAGRVTATGGQSRRIIQRPRLKDLLDGATARLLLLVAPAGYGKTTFARQWLEDKPHAWFRATDSSADVAALAIGLAAAADRFGGNTTSIIESRLRATRDPEQEATLLGELLAENFSEWPADAWLALDDYHFLSASRGAERFVDALLTNVGCRIIVTARHRPAWATPRRILYGELFELGQNILAMNHDEARDLLGPDATESDALLSLAQGWPAVLGLISTNTNLRGADGLSSDVYDYFAEELFQRVERDVKRELPKLAIPSSIDREVAIHLFGPDFAAVMETAEKYGFASRMAATGWEVHPLIRAFLETKLDIGAAKLETKLDIGAAKGEPAGLIDGLIALFLDARRWDDAFSIIERFDSSHRLPELLTAALDSLLVTGRVATLARWLKFAEARGLHSPLLTIAEAEVAFRNGKCGKAETLARQAVASATDDDELAKAYILAGKSAHFRERLAEALTNFGRAEEHATSPALLREALWGQFVASLDIDLGRAIAASERYADLENHRIDDEVRVANARMAISRRRGQSVEQFTDAKHIFETAARADPTVQCAFLNVYGGSLVSVAVYDEAYAVADRELLVAKKFRLDFVQPHALLTKASSCLGLREFREARKLIRDSQSTSPEDDPHVHLFARTLKMQLLLAEGAVTEALAEARQVAVAFPSRTVQAEFIAMQSLVHASAGETHHALRLARQAALTANNVETHVLVACVRMIAGLQRGAPHTERLARRALVLAFETGNLNDLIVAYRSSSTILSPLAGLRDLRESLDVVITRGRDWQLAAEAGLAIPEGVAPRPSALSPREREVYRLLADGRSNREIADVLFISEVTAKVHVRRILEKVGARSRTEAAIRLARAPELLDA